MRVLLVGLAVAILVFLLTSGHVVFLPLLLVFPLVGFWGRGRRRRRFPNGAIRGQL